MKRKNTIIFLSLVLICVMMGCGKSDQYLYTVKMKTQLIPYIEDYIDKVGKKKENIDKKYLEMTIKKYNNYYLVDVCFEWNLDYYQMTYNPILFTAPIKGKTLLIDDHALDLMLDQDEESIFKYVKDNYPDEYNEFESWKKSHVFNPVAGFFDQLLLLLDSNGNVVEHTILFTDDGQKFYERKDSLERIFSQKCQTDISL